MIRRKKNKLSSRDQISKSHRSNTYPTKQTSFTTCLSLSPSLSTHHISTQKFSFLSPMKRFHPSRSISVALFLVLLAFFSSKFHTEGLRDLQISKEMKEKSLGGSLRGIPRSRYSPIQNK